MKKSILSFSGIAILGVILLLTNAISSQIFSRFFADLTEEGIYSLSDGTKNVLAKLNSPITLRYFFSRTDSAKFPGAKLFADRIEELLRQYERASGGKLTLELNDPRPDTEQEEWALKYGLSPMQLPTGGNLFFGLAGVNADGEEESIPVFNLAREEFLEYDITKLVDTLGQPKKSTIGIISPLKLEGEPAAPSPFGQGGGNSDPWIFISQLKRLAEVKFLGTDVATIGPEIGVLMVIHPKGLPEQTKYAIDQYVVGGGNLFVAVDPYCGADNAQADPSNPMAGMMAERSSDLNDLLQTWGVTAKPKSMLADINLATQVSQGRGSGAEGFVAWLTLSNAPTPEPLINRSDVVTAELENLMLAWPGLLEVKAPEGVTSEVLLRSTDEAMVLGENDYRFNAQNPAQLLRSYRPGTAAQVLAVKLQGVIKSNFKNKPGVEQDANMSTPDGHKLLGTKPSTIVVVADADFLTDQYSAVEQNLLGSRVVSLLNDNLVFAMNAVENLSGSSDLISLRSRGKFVRPFTKVQQIEANAQARWQHEEGVLQAKLNQANQRLSELQGGTGRSGDGKAVFNEALMGEVKKFKEERAVAQSRLREVRRNLRQDKERLGNLLFLFNAFAVPCALVAYALIQSGSFGRLRTRKA